VTDLEPEEEPEAASKATPEPVPALDPETGFEQESKINLYPEPPPDRRAAIDSDPEFAEIIEHTEPFIALAVNDLSGEEAEKFLVLLLVRAASDLGGRALMSIVQQAWKKLGHADVSFSTFHPSHRPEYVAHSNEE